jgi:hypothetical protein
MREFTQQQLTAARQSARLEAIVAVDVQLMPSPTAGGPLVGPCPFCGEGRDRFHVYTEGQRFWCRRCNQKGDLVEYIARRRGLSFVNAVKYLLGESNELAALPQLIHQADEAPAASLTPDEWAASLTPFVYKAIDCLAMTRTPAALAAMQWLEARGVTAADEPRFGLGYAGEWRTFADGYKLPPGLIIPRWRPGDMELTAVNVYLAKEARQGDNRRRMVKGSQARSWFGAELIGNARRVVICEGELEDRKSTRLNSSHDRVV